MKKKCTKCARRLALSSFDKDKTKRDGVYSSCKDCRHKRSVEVYAVNGERERKARMEYYRRNTARERANMRAWYIRNRAHALAQKARELNRVPAWADLKKIERFYIKAAKLGLTVDHVIPLQGRNVSGLHVHNNLQLLTARANARKATSWVIE
jgi:hypothetical protein